MNNQSHHLAAIILAAGKGKRMQNTESVNKVTSLLASKPMINHIVEFMEKIAVEEIVVVVGHARDSVIDVLRDHTIIYAEQTEQLGTGDAVKIALETLSPEVTDVLVVYGDDAVLYSTNNTQIISDMVESHYQKQTAITFLTIEQEPPFGLGRIVRDEKDAVLEIVEEKDANDQQRKITEINPGCFVFGVKFLYEYLPRIEKSPATGEYYLTSLIDIDLNDGQKVETVKGGKLAWRGVNTPDELDEANKLFAQLG